MIRTCCKLIFFFFLISACSLFSYGQVKLVTEEDNQVSILSFSNPTTYEIGGITTTGALNFDTRLLLFKVGDRIEIPGDQTSNSIKNIWKSGLYEDVEMTLTRVVDGVAFINVHVTERNRLVAFGFKGIKKNQETDLRDKIKLAQGNIVNENMIQTCINVIKKFFIEKGFYNCEVKVEVKPDDKISKGVNIIFHIDKGKKVKIDRIIINGVSMPQGKLTKTMKGSKERSRFEIMSKADTVFMFMIKNLDYYKSKDLLEHLDDYFSDRVKLRIAKSSKFIRDSYENDKVSLVDKLNDYGYRDAYITFDTVIFDENYAYVFIDVQEGHKYYFRNIDFVGNTKYPTRVLKEILNIEKGDVYNQSILNDRLFQDKNGNDIASLYMNDGYLFFNAIPVEIRVDGDSIDMEIRVREGKQAKYNKITVSGNNKTSDRVILREVTTIPGQMFNKADLIRSQQMLLSMGYFNQESINVIPKPNEADGTVDLEYVVEEASSDQLQLSLGYGITGLIFSAGVTFNNFSFKKFFKKDAWTPIPSGDGQRLSFNASASTKYYQYYSVSFTEPWIGGKKPNSLTAAISYQIQTDGTSKTDLRHMAIKILGLSVSYGQKLKWPDDYFQIMHTLSYQYYNVQNYDLSIFDNGFANNISYTFTVLRNSVDALIYPRQGSEIMFSAQFTPPYSLFNSSKDKNYYVNASPQEKYRWLELHKWKFNISWFTRLVENLVLNVRFKSGFIGCYNKNIGVAPFERFYLGGDGLSNYAYDGREVIGMRGYDDSSLTPTLSNVAIGAAIFNKFTAELRYPVTLNPSATIYLLGFAEAGNSWLDKRQYSPFKLYKSAGVGIRIFLPMFGLLGFDWGYGFDEIPGRPGLNKGHFHISINSSID